MSTTPSPARRYDIDWLRIIAVLFLFTFHTARIFDVWEINYVQNDVLSLPLTTFAKMLVVPWHMPLFFLLAGASTWFALGFRSRGQYVGERLKRLLVPLIFGVCVLAIPQGYYALVHHAGYTGTILEYYPTFFTSFDFNDLTGYTGGFTPSHYWFILFLFVLSLIALPLFLYLRRPGGQRLLNGLAALMTRPGAIFLLALPLVVARFLPDLGGKNPFTYFLLLVYGYVLMSDDRFTQAIDRHKGVALVLALPTLGVVGALLLSSQMAFAETGWDLLWGFTMTFGTWFCLIALLGYGRKWLNRSHRWLKYASEAAYPYYLLHQTIIMVIGFYVVQWQADLLVKYGFIVVSSFMVTALLYELARRVNVLRFLLGMKPKLRRTESVRRTGALKPA